MCIRDSSICLTSLCLGGDDGWSPSLVGAPTASAIGRIGLGGETYVAAFVRCCGTSAAAAAAGLDDEDDDAAADADAVAAVNSLILFLLHVLQPQQIYYRLIFLRFLTLVFL